MRGEDLSPPPTLCAEEGEMGIGLAMVYKGTCIPGFLILNFCPSPKQTTNPSL